MSLERKWLIAAAAVVLFNLMLVIVFGDNGLVELSRMRDRQRQLAAGNETLARENVSLYRIIGRLKNDPVYIESVARNELGMIGKDDVILLRTTEKTAGKQYER
jgi:cell division protein FtsB